MTKIVTINVEDRYSVKVRGHEVEIDLTKARDLEGIVTRLFEYGFRKFNDASPNGAIAPKEEAALVAFKAQCADNARAHIADWLAGKFEADRDRAPTDPVAKEARDIAKDLAGKPPHKDDEAGKAAWTARVNELCRNEDVLAEARERVAKIAKLAALIKA